MQNVDDESLQMFGKCDKFMTPHFEVVGVREVVAPGQTAVAIAVQAQGNV